MQKRHVLLTSISAAIFSIAAMRGESCDIAIDFATEEVVT